MRGLKKLTNAASTQQAREDYWKLVRLAQEINLSGLIPIVRTNASWRTLDVAAKVGVENLLRERPDLREVVRRIYPGLIPGDGTLTVKKV